VLRGQNLELSLELGRFTVLPDGTIDIHELSAGVRTLIHQTKIKS
jgi:hypothetical protein